MKKEIKAINRIVLLSLVGYILSSSFSMIPAFINIDPVIKGSFVYIGLMLIPGTYYLFNKKEIIPKIEKPTKGSLVEGVKLGFIVIPFMIIASAIAQYFKITSTVDMDLAYDVIKGYPIVLMGIIIVILPALCEEFVFRQILFKGYVKQGVNTLLAAVVSAGMFGLFHMNFVQIPYAIVAGIIFAYGIKKTDNLWTSIIAHAIVNGTTLISLYVPEKVASVIGVIAVLAGGIFFVLFVREQSKEKEADVKNFIMIDKTSDYKIFSFSLIFTISMLIAMTILVEQLTPLLG